MQDNKYVWKLEDIYADEQAWYQDLETVKQLAKKLTAMQGRVCQDGHTLLETLDLTVKCNEYFSKLFVYAHCHYDAEMANANYKKLYETVSGQSNAISEQTAFVMPLRYNNDKQKKPLFSRGLSVCRLLFNSFSKLKIDENYKEKRRLFY